MTSLQDNQKLLTEWQKDTNIRIVNTIYNKILKKINETDIQKEVMNSVEEGYSGIVLYAEGDLELLSKDQTTKIYNTLKFILINAHLTPDDPVYYKDNPYAVPFVNVRNGDIGVHVTSYTDNRDSNVVCIGAQLGFNRQFKYI